MRLFMTDGKVKAIDLFAGIGGIRLGFEQAFGDAMETVFASEWNKFSRQTYEANFDDPSEIAGDITEVPASEVPDHDILLAGFPCLTGDMNVLTEEGYMPISSVRPGVSVMGHDGKWHMVEAFMENGVRKTYRMKGYGFPSIRATGNHRFLVRHKYVVYESDGVYRRHFEEPEWLTLDKIMDNPKDYYLASPVVRIDDALPEWEGVQVRINKTATRVRKDIDVSDEGIWYLAGRYLGDGWLRKQCKSGSKRHKYSGIVIACGKHKVEKFTSKLDSYGFKYTVAHERTVDKYHFLSVEIACFMEKFFGTGAEGKFIHGSVLALPEHLLRALIDGYVDSDGYHVKDSKCGKIQLTSINRRLLLGMSACIEKVYDVPCRIAKVKSAPRQTIEGRTVNAKDFFNLTFDTKPTSRKHAFMDDEYAWHPLKSVEYHGEEPVYDIAVEGCHSFVVEHCVSHNCQPFSVAGVSKKRSLGRPTGFEDETQGTLFFEVARIIDAKRPKAFFLENVKNLVSHDRGNTFRVIMHVLTEDLGYHVHWRIVDGMHWTPQHRERIYIVGFRDDVPFDYGRLAVPESGGTFADVMETNVPEKYTLSDKLWGYLQAYAEKHRARGNGFGYGLVGPEDTTRTISARYYKDGSECLVRQDGTNPRKLTPRECARLQGFPDSFEIPVSDTQAYRQFGNSVCVPAVAAVARLMREALWTSGRSATTSR